MCRLGTFLTVVLMSVVLAGPTLANPDQWKRAGFLTDFSKATVSFDTIFSGGPPKDGIPSIDTPNFVKASAVTWLDDAEPVIQLELNGTSKAYPLQILIWHEIVNDEVSGQPVAVTYCPLCNSSIVFDRRFDETILDFGTTGLLRNSDLVMYDRQTETWWQQFTGEGIVGSHAGRNLKMLPSRVVSFADFRSEHPDAHVLDRPTPAQRDYGRNPYVGYDSRSAPYPLYQGDLPENILPMERVVIVNDGKQRLAATLKHVRDAKRVALSDSITLKWTGEQTSTLDQSQIGDGRKIGTVEAIKRENGREKSLVHDLTFAFVVYAFYPDLPILGINSR